MMALPPLRRIVERGYGSSTLECGHVVTTPKNRDTRRTRCTVCLPLAERQAYMAKKKQKRHILWGKRAVLLT